MSSRRLASEAAMPAAFNAYHEWLGLPADATSPSYYQILGLKELEADAAKISQAGYRAVTRVRGFRPGSHAKEWSRLLDEITSAKTCLLDPVVKKEYDRCLRSGSSATASERATAAPAAKAIERAPIDVNRFPPGMAPLGVGPSAPQSSESAPTTAPAAAVDHLLPAPSVDHLLPTGTALPMPAPGWPAAASPVPMAQPVWQQATSAGYAVPVSAVPMQPPGYAPMAVPLGYSSPMTPLAAPAAVPVDPMAPMAAPAAMPAYTATGFNLLPASAYAGPLPSDAMQPSYALPPGSLLPPPAPAGVPPLPQVKPAMADSSVLVVQARRKQESQRNMLVAVMAGCLLLTAAVVGYANREALFGSGEKLIAQLPSESDPVDTSGDAPQPLPRTVEGSLPKKIEVKKPEPKPAPEPMPVPMPEVNPEPMPDPAPMPEPTTEPKPEPTPEPKPESTPVPPPMPEPMPPSMPTKAELVALGNALTAGKEALTKYDFITADEQIAAAESLAKLPEHQAMVARQKEVASYVKQFRNAVNEALKGLQIGSEIKVGSSTMVAVVAVSSEKLTIRRAGGNVTYVIGELPAGLTMALADSWLNASDPVNRVVRGSYFAVAEGDVDSHREKAKKYWEEAAAGGVDIKPILPFLTDKYDLDKQAEAAAKPEAKSADAKPAESKPSE